MVVCGKEDGYTPVERGEAFCDSGPRTGERAA
jgi:hypothetical protein